MDPACEGQISEGLLGYTLAYWHLIRYANTGSPYDHFSSSIRIPGRYRPEWSLGVLSMADRGATSVPLTTCTDRATGDVFSSLDTACEGQEVTQRAGFIWTTPPEDGPGKQLFRCVAANGERFEDSVPVEPDVPAEPSCGDGATLDVVLGYLLAQV
jgi:hypothetical protein